MGSLFRARDDGPKVRASHILVEDRARAEDLLRKVRGGEDFAALAAEHAKCPSGKANGGDLGEFTRGRMVKAFEDAAFALQPGQVSDLVPTRFGYHIIKRTA